MVVLTLDFLLCILTYFVPIFMHLALIKTPTILSLISTNLCSHAGEQYGHKFKVAVKQFLSRSSTASAKSSHLVNKHKFLAGISNDYSNAHCLPKFGRYGQMHSFSTLHLCSFMCFALTGAYKYHVSAH